MLTSTRTAVSQQRWLLALPVVVALLLVTTWLSRPAQSAIPDAERIGTVTYDDLGDAQKTRLPISSFDWQIDQPKPASGGGGGGGKATLGDPKVIQEISAASPLIMKNIITGRHIKTITVVLFRNGTTTPAERWVFNSVMLLQDHPSLNGKSTTSSEESVTFMFDTVSETSFATDGTTVVQSYCWNPALGQQC